MHAVVGTSGFTRERIDEVRSFWGDDGPGCLIVPNFSIGAVLMMRFAEMAAPHFAGVEIVERHHHDKPDAPSGTSIATAQRIAAAGGSSIELSAEMVEGDADVEHLSGRGPAGLPGAIDRVDTSYAKFAEQGVDAVRLGIDDELKPVTESDVLNARRAARSIGQRPLTP